MACVAIIDVFDAPEICGGDVDYFLHAEVVCHSADGVKDPRCLHHDYLPAQAAEHTLSKDCFCGPSVEEVPPREPQDISNADIERRFAVLPLVVGQVEILEDVKTAYRGFARELADLLPAGREKSLAFTALEESTFWAGAAVARDEGN